MLIFCIYLNLVYIQYLFIRYFFFYEIKNYGIKKSIEFHLYTSNNEVLEHGIVLSQLYI